MRPMLLLVVSLLLLIQGVLGLVVPSAPLVLDRCLKCCGPPPCCSTCDPVLKPGSCPSNKFPDRACIQIVRPEDCTDDSSCPGKQKCCRVGCFPTCVDPENVCPVIICFPCDNEYELDDNGCQTCTCKREECPLPKCVAPPPSSCIEPDFKIFNGVKCPWCPKIVPCKANCDAGQPLPNINCGIRPDRQHCPAGFFCNVDPLDPRNAACCTGCTTGKPLPNVRCDDVKHTCPSGYRCKKIHGICCPDVCSAVAKDSKCYMYTRDCRDDSSCPYGKKCCRQGCSYVCVNPV